MDCVRLRKRQRGWGLLGHMLRWLWCGRVPREVWLQVCPHQRGRERIFPYWVLMWWRRVKRRQRWRLL